MKLFAVKDVLADVRPEFLEDVIEDSGFHLRREVHGGLTEATLLRRVIGVGQASFQCVAAYLGPVKGRASRIRLPDEGVGYRVAGSVEKTSLAQGVIARVLVRERWDNGLGEKSSGYSVSEGAPIIASIAGDSVPQFRIGIQEHGLPGQDSGPSVGRVIGDAVLRGEYEFLSGGHRRKLRVGVHRSKIGDHPEHTLALRTLGIVFLFLFVLVLGGSRFAL